MKMFSWNVNGLRSVARKNEIQKVINSSEYDVILLQETKIEEING